MTVLKRNYYNEAVSMKEFILEGHNEKETAEEFGVSTGTVRKRLSYYLNCTYADLAEMRKKGNSKY